MALRRLDSKLLARAFLLDEWLVAAAGSRHSTRSAIDAGQLEIDEMLSG
jgi:hypothetical protein